MSKRTITDEQLKRAYAAADTVVNRLFFLQDAFEALSNPNIVDKAMVVTEVLGDPKGDI